MRRKVFWFFIAGLFLALFAYLSFAAEPRSKITTSRFRAQVACPSTGKFIGPCPGWVMDHLHSLRCGGKDVPENLWWQPLVEAQAKDLAEKQCFRYFPGVPK